LLLAGAMLLYSWADAEEFVEYQTFFESGSDEFEQGVLQCVAVCGSVLQCVAVCCSVLQCVAVCCSVLQCLYCVAVWCGVV